MRTKARMSYVFATLLAAGVGGAGTLLGASAGFAAESSEGGKTVAKPVQITVGVEKGDIRGSTNKALQAAVDYVAAQGGGVVRIGPGKYAMRNALFLRDGVKVIGTPGKTVLSACAGAVSLLRLDGDCNERQVTLVDPSKFRPGYGISVKDKNMGGFGVTTATLLAQTSADTFKISRPLYYDYMVHNKASARLTFPVVGGYQVKNASIEGVVVEGNRKKTQPLNGCRGAGIYLFECENIRIADCVVKGYNGDGISFQVSQKVTVEGCEVSGCAGIGLHPGSGSQDPVVRNNTSTKNDGDGMYVCWRVKRGLFEGNVLRENKRDGISIGHKDTDNMFRNNRVSRNERDGLRFRKESEPMAAHRNTFEGNEFLDNGGGRADCYPVRILGPTKGLVFRNNKIGYTTGRKRGVAFRVGNDVEDLKLEGNELLKIKSERSTGE